MDSKSLLTILVTAVIAGGGVYLWQSQENEAQQQLPPETTVTEEKVNDSPQTIDIVELAKNSDSSFLYLVSSPNWKETSAILKAGDQKFAFTYAYNDWRMLNFTQLDSTATDGPGASYNDLEQLAIYDFCQSACDRENRKGKGFQLTIWNANYSGRGENPDFYQRNGEFFVTESSDFIVTYKPYQGILPMETLNAEIAKAAAKLFESFEIIE